MPNPAKRSETDGIIVSLMTPTHNPKLDAFVVILEAQNLTEIARGYFPEGYRLSTGFHGIYLNT